MAPSLVAYLGLVAYRSLQIVLTVASGWVLGSVLAKAEGMVVSLVAVEEEEEAELSVIGVVPLVDLVRQKQARKKN